MYATIRVYSGSPDLADALVEREADVTALIGRIEGFKAYYLVKTADGAASISVFDSQDGAEESNSVAAGWLRENLPDVSPSPPAVSAGEVVISA